MSVRGTVDDSGVGASAGNSGVAARGHDARVGWQAELALGFEARGERTVVARQAHRGPLRIQRPFYPESNGTCHVYLLHPPGGVVGGDELTLEVDVAAEARALLTTPGASKLYRSQGKAARIEQRLTAQSRACLEWLPHETIAFDGTRSQVRTHVRLAADAAYAGWEIVCLGRPAAGERFGRGSLRLEQRVEREGQLIWIERAEYRGDDPVLSAAWGLAGHAVVGSFVIAAPTPMLAWAERVRADVTPRSEHGFAVTSCPNVLVLRYLGDHVHEALALFCAAWRCLRPCYAAAAAVTPRIWHT
jgi:urease accessory protein